MGGGGDERVLGEAVLLVYSEMQGLWKLRWIWRTVESSGGWDIGGTQMKCLGE